MLDYIMAVNHRQSGHVWTIWALAKFLSPNSMPYVGVIVFVMSSLFSGVLLMWCYEHAVFLSFLMPFAMFLRAKLVIDSNRTMMYVHACRLKAWAQTDNYKAHLLQQNNLAPLVLSGPQVKNLQKRMVFPLGLQHTGEWKGVGHSICLLRLMF